MIVNKENRLMVVSRIHERVLPCVLLLMTVLCSFNGCSHSLPRAEIDCTKFSRPLQRDQFTPPSENDTIDTSTAEKMILRKAYPQYPELAVRAGLEGKVVVKVWIGHDGIVKQALIDRSDAEIFNDVALDAARRLLFKRPSCGGIVVSVWARIPMKFKLVDR
jgi:TonB family protein